MSIVHRNILSKTIYMSFMLSIIMLLNLSSRAQYCEFDHRMRSGGNYFFATYFTGFDLKTPREDTCDRVINGVLIEHHVFSEGIMQEEILYQWDTQKPYQEFHRIQQDSVLGFFIHYDYEGRITDKKTFYTSSNGKRCYEEAMFQNGVLTAVSTFRFIHADELKEKGYTPVTETGMDKDGYTEYVSLFGTERTFHANGRIATIKHHRFVVHAGSNYEKTQEGEYGYYDEQGILRIKGQYDRGTAHGVFQYYHANGKISEIKEFDHDRSIGVWRGFDEHGYPQYVSTFSDIFWYEIPHEVRYSPNGTLLYEKVIYKNGSGFQNLFYPNGQLQERLEYTIGPQYPSATWRYYESGLLRQKSFTQAHHDTLSAEYFEDGSIYRLNLYDSKTTQETWEYFSPGRLMKHCYTRNSTAGVSQSFQEYHENGMIKWEMELENDHRTDKYYWNSGLLRESKEQISNLLNGAWIVYDSIGIEIKNCQYREGLRWGPCKTTELIKTEAIGTSEWKKLRVIVEKAYACSFYQKNAPDKYTQKELDKEADVLSQLWSYLKFYHCDWPLADISDHDEQFSYFINVSDTVFLNHRTSIDSILQSLNMKSIDAWNIQSGYATCKCQSRDLYTLNGLKKAFAKVIPEPTLAFELINGCNRIGIDLDYFLPEDTFTYLIEHVNGGEKISITNQHWSKTFVVYDDGYIELYNAIGSMDCDEPLLRKIKKY